MVNYVVRDKLNNRQQSQSENEYALRGSKFTNPLGLNMG